MKRRLFGVMGGALSLAIIAGLATAQNQGKGEGASSAGDLARKRKIDEFNDAVADKDSPPTPERGGQVRIRIPIEPKGLNRIIENGAQARTITSLILEPLIERDYATFEWVPRIARSWEQRDVLLLKPEKEGMEPQALEGLLVERGEKVVRFGVGGTLMTLGKHDLLSYDIAKGEVVTKDRVVVGEAGSRREYSGKLVKKTDAELTLAVDMAWQPKEEKTFKLAEVTFVPSETIKGAVREGNDRDDSWTVKVAIQGSDIKEIPLEKVLQREVKTGSRSSMEPAIFRQVVMYFHMRKGVRWHDGKPVTPDDVVFSLETIRNTFVDCAPLRNYYIDIASCSKVGEDTVRFEYSKQYFRALSFCGGITIMPKHRYSPERFAGDEEGFGQHFNTHEDNRKLVGAGPFRFSRWEKGLQIEVVRNDDFYVKQAGLPYYHADRPYLDKISWIVINDKNASLKQLRKGEIDADFDIEPLTWRDPDTQSAEFTKEVVRAQFLQPLYTYIGWNQVRPGVDEKQLFFKDSKVRQAMTMLIDRKTILEEIHGGLGEIVSGPFYRYGPFHDERVEAIEYNPERAKVLLDEAGWIDHDGDGVRDKDGVKFEFEYLIHNARAYHQKIADKVKESVEQAGIVMNIRKIDWRVFQDTVRDHKFDAVRFAWGEPACIETDPYQIWHSSQSEDRGSNTISFADERADALIERARRELDFGERQKLMKRLHRLLAREQPYTFLFNFYSLYFYNKRYRNVKFYIIGEEPYDLTEWYVPKALQRKG